MFLDLPKLFERELDRERFRRLSHEIYLLERRFCFRDFARSAKLCCEQLQASGVARTELIPIKADGVNEALDFVMPQAWDVDSASLQIVSPEVPEPLLADLKLNPMTVANRGAPTPPEGITAEIVTLEAMRAGAEVRGKILFTEHEIVTCGNLLARDAIAKGALALISCGSSIADKEPDGAPWINGWGWPYWYHCKGDPIAPCFSISPSRARYLASLLRKHGKVTVKAVCNSRLYDGEVHTVSALIPGERAEEIVLLAHLYEPFISDDASGAAALIEIARMITALTASGRLPKLRRSIRLLLSMEQFGFAHFFASAERRACTLTAVNMDSITYETRALDGKVSLFKSPHTLPFIGDFLLHEMAEQSLGQFYVFGPTYRWADNDNFVSDSTLGIPSSWLTALPGKLHHNSADNLEHFVDWRVGGKIASTVGAYAYALATLSDDDAAALLRLSSRRARAEVLEQAQILDGLVRGEKTDASTAGEWLRLFGGWQQDRLRTISTLSRETDPAEHCRELNALTDSECRRMGAAAAPHKPLTSEERFAEGLVVRRLGAWCPASQARVPAAERFPAGWWEVLNWCDGQRTVLDCVRLHAAERLSELAPTDIARLLEYLQKLERYGYVAICKR